MHRANRVCTKFIYISKSHFIYNPNFSLGFVVGDYSSQEGTSSSVGVAVGITLALMTVVIILLAVVFW